MMKFNWNEKAIEKLKALAADPAGYSARQIGEIMGLTKNQVISKLQRLNGAPSVETGPRKESISSGLARGSFGKKVKGWAPEPKAVSVPLPKAVAANIAVEESNPVTLARRTIRQCCWPLGNPRSEDFRYCGAAVEPPINYCDQHRAMMYRRQGEAA